MNRSWIVNYVSVVVCRIGDNSWRHGESWSNIWAGHQPTQARHAWGAVEGVHWFPDWARGVWQDSQTVQKAAGTNSTCQGREDQKFTSFLAISLVLS